MSTTTTTVNYGPSQSSMEGELPILVGLLAIIIGLVGLFFAVIGIIIILVAIGSIAVPAASAFAVLSGSTLFAGLLTLILGGVLLAVASGLWDCEMWALVVAGIVVAVIIGLLVVAGSYGWSLLISVCAFVYLIAVSNHFY